MRYGDDFILIAKTRKEAHYYQREATSFLKTMLNLDINPRNNIIVSVSAGLHFLGHVITDRYIVVDRHTTKSIIHKINISNLSSYQSLLLVESIKTQLYWQILDKINKIIDY